MESKAAKPILLKKQAGAIRAPPGTKVCVITKKELEELKRTNKLKQADPTKSPNVFLIKQQLCDKLRTTEPTKKLMLRQVVRTANTQGTQASPEKKTLVQVVQPKKPVRILRATSSGEKITESSAKEAAEQKKGIIFKTKIISNSKVKLLETDVKKIFTNNAPKQLKRLKTDDDDVKFKPNGRPAKTYLRNPDAATFTESYETTKTGKTNEQTNVGPVPRRRGRPRKTASSAKQERFTSDSEDEDWKPNQYASKKRKRAYKKKFWEGDISSPEDEDEDEDGSSAMEDEEPLIKRAIARSPEVEMPKRRPGRPPKPKPKLDVTSEVKNSLFEEGVSPSTPRKRGRPRKVPLPEKSAEESPVEDEEKSEEVSSADETLPLSKKRKRKNINYFELANPKSLDEWAEDKRQPDKNKSEEKLENAVEKKATTKVTKIVITEKRVTPGYVEIDFCAKDLNEQDQEIVEQEEKKNNTDDDAEIEENSMDDVESKENSVKVIKSSDEGKSGEVIYVIQQINKKDGEESGELEFRIQTEKGSEEDEREAPSEVPVETREAEEKIGDPEVDADTVKCNEDVEKEDDSKKGDTEDAANNSKDVTEAVAESSAGGEKTEQKETAEETVEENIVNEKSNEAADAVGDDCNTTSSTTNDSFVECHVPKSNDESNTVKCQVCQKQLNPNAWEYHNKSYHNLLAWNSEEIKPEFTKDSVSRLVREIVEEKKGAKCDKCYIKFKKKEEFVDHWMTCKGTNSPTTTCAVCQMVVPKTMWKDHKHKDHNNLAWQVGEKSIDLSNKSVVKGILNGLYKSKKLLYCDKCGETKRSVDGYLSHNSLCMKSQAEKEALRIQCEKCPAKILPVSMYYHMTHVHGPAGERKLAEQQEIEKFDPNTKRRAAKKAMKIINKISDKLDDNDYYACNINFAESDFIQEMLPKELKETAEIKCKFSECSFKCETIEEIYKHLVSCEKRPETFFICKKCLLIFATEQEMRDHIQETYKVVLKEKDEEFVAGEFSEDEEEYTEQVSIRKAVQNEKSKAENDIKYKPKPTFLLPLSKINRTHTLFYYAHSWMMDFCDENYSTPIVFEKYRIPIDNWSLMDVDKIEDYLPPLTESCDIEFTMVKGFENCLNRDYTPKPLQLFESINSDRGDPVMFCGGPITALSWLPTPYTKSDSSQLLALATLSSPDLICSYNEIYHEKTLIQFWNFGTLRNKEVVNITPKFAFGICFDYGPIWHLEWCPSGCYDFEEKIRVGLLAVTGCDGYVYIYSIPMTEENNLFYKSKIVAKLQLDINEPPSNFYATRTSWSKVGGHSYIAVGYSNGIVALFDFNNDSRLLKQTVNGVDVILPYKRFVAHDHYISVLSLFHLNGGNRWLLTGSFDRHAHVWDLETDLKISSTKKHIIADGTFLTHWMAYITNLEESTSLHQVHSTVTNIRNFLADPTNVTASLGSLRSISYSDWLNLVLNGNSCGELFCFAAHQLLHGIENDKVIRNCKFLFGYTTLIEKNKTPEERCAIEGLKMKASNTSLQSRKKLESKDSETNLDNNPYYDEPITYDQTCEKYGLVFCDMKLDHFASFPKNMADQLGNNCVKFSISKPNLYSLQAINKVAVNPNKQSSTFFAVGYQAGFLRVSCMKFLNKDDQVR